MPQNNEALAVIQEQLQERHIDAFYMEKCLWPNKIKGIGPKDSLRQLEEVMRKYESCYARHNGLVEVLEQ